jgi:hypothetical protein
MNACFTGQVEVVRLLLDRGADPNVLSRNAHKYRPLHRTIERKISLPRGQTHLDVVRLLLDRGADPTARGAWHGVSAIAVAAMGGDRRFLEPLLERAGALSIFDAAVAGDAGRIRELLAAEPGLAGAVDGNGWTPLRYVTQSRLGASDPAADAALAEIGCLLLAAGASPDGALDAAVYGNSVALTSLLLEHGAKITDGDTLNHAACDGAHEALELVYRAGTDLQLTDGTEHHGGYTPYGCTLTCRSVRGARWFLDHGVDVDHVGGEKGELAMHVAVRSGAGPDLLKLLISRGANVSAAEGEGLTPLQIARERGQKSAVAVLEAAGAPG